MGRETVKAPPLHPMRRPRDCSGVYIHRPTHQPSEAVRSTTKRCPAVKRGAVSPPLKPRSGWRSLTPPHHAPAHPPSAGPARLRRRLSAAVLLRLILFHCSVLASSTGGVRPPAPPQPLPSRGRRPKPPSRCRPSSPAPPQSRRPVLPRCRHARLSRWFPLRSPSWRC